MYNEVLGNYSGSSHWNLYISEKVQGNPSLQLDKGVLKSQLHQLAIIFTFRESIALKVVQRGVGFSQFKKKCFAIHHYTTAITSVSIKMSKVWEYYEKLGKDEAKCLLCKKVVSCKASSKQYLYVIQMVIINFTRTLIF